MALKREIGTLGILFASVSAIIGSGWLFGPLYAAQMAGPAAILSWILGGTAVIFIAFCFAELACLFPMAGGISLFPLFSHGKLVSFIISWISWLAFVVIAPIEVQAVVQYAANYLPILMSKKEGLSTLSGYGFSAACGLLFLLTVANAISVQFMSKLNFLLTVWKLFIPICVVSFFLHTRFEPHNLYQFGGFAPQGAHGVFSSLAVGGIVLAFNGFQPGIALAGETKNPKKNIPIAILGSLSICTLIYCLLQFAFLTAIPSNFLHQGWKNLSFVQEAGPLAGLSIVLGLGWLAKGLYIDALVSPMGSAVVFFAAAARTSFAMSKNEFLPQFFQTTTARGVPIWGVIFNFFISILIFLTFTGWQQMAAFYAAAICFCNSFIPLTLVALRRHKNLTSPFQIPFYKAFAFGSFYISNLMFYWCGWDILLRLDVVIGIVLLLALTHTFLQKKNIFSHYKPALSMLFFIICMSIVSKCGSYGGGLGLINTKMEFVVVFFVSVLVYLTSKKYSLTSKESLEKIQVYAKNSMDT